MIPLPEIPALEQHFTVSQIAPLWGIDESKVRSIFQDMPGVLVIRSPRLRGKRTYSLIRVPQSVLDRAYAEWTGGFRGEVERGRRK